MSLLSEDESHGTTDDLSLLDGGSDWYSRVLPHDADSSGSYLGLNARVDRSLRIALVEDSPYVARDRPLSDAIRSFLVAANKLSAR